MPDHNMGIPLDMFLKLYEQNSKYYSVLLDNSDPAFAGKLKNSIKPKLKTALASDYVMDDTELDFILEYVFFCYDWYYKLLVQTE